MSSYIFIQLGVLLLPRMERPVSGVSGIREFLRGTGGRKVTVFVLIIGLGAAGWSIWNNMSADQSTQDANSPIFIDSETGKSFHVKMELGMQIPVKSPDTGNMTGYPAELCYWTKDGQIKDQPTPVLLNSFIGKTGPTFCPDCGRLVVPHNPVPQAGSRPPPTQAQYMARISGNMP
jgi:hypothetical protein